MERKPSRGFNSRPDSDERDDAPGSTIAPNPRRSRPDPTESNVMSPGGTVTPLRILESRIEDQNEEIRGFYADRGLLMAVNQAVTAQTHGLAELRKEVLEKMDLMKLSQEDERARAKAFRAEHRKSAAEQKKSTERAQAPLLGLVGLTVFQQAGVQSGSTIAGSVMIIILAYFFPEVWAKIKPGGKTEEPPPPPVDTSAAPPPARGHDRRA